MGPRFVTKEEEMLLFRFFLSVLLLDSLCIDAKKWDAADVPNSRAEPSLCIAPTKLAAITALFNASSSSDVAESSKPQLPPLWVCDPDGVFSAETFVLLHTELEQLHASSSVEGAASLILIESMAESAKPPRAAKTFARALHDRHRLGDKETQMGVVLFFAFGDRQCYVSTGKGARSLISDAFVTEEVLPPLLPLLRAEDYDGAMVGCVHDVATRIEKSQNEAEEQTASSSLFSSCAILSFIKMIFSALMSGAWWLMVALAGSVLSQFLILLPIGLPFLLLAWIWGRWQYRRTAARVQALQRLLQDHNGAGGANMQHRPVLSPLCPICLEAFPAAHVKEMKKLEAAMLEEEQRKEQKKSKEKNRRSTAASSLPSSSSSSSSDLSPSTSFSSSSSSSLSSSSSSPAPLPSAPRESSFCWRAHRSTFVIGLAGIRIRHRLLLHHRSLLQLLPASMGRKLLHPLLFLILLLSS